MRIRGIGFAGTHTAASEEMERFLEDVLGLARARVGGSGAAFFACPDGDVFGVARALDTGGEQRTIGFLVDDLQSALIELREAGVETDEIAENARWRYAHFTAPDGNLYELVEERTAR